ncbi:SU10 major capsid protein [Burkholderia cenocepacia]|uniref:SU10 major capsid protein n=1 Tax=Burkholderia cenocepacia TaxID=95486 RepID=UPI0009813204|nr:DUF5309 family protein [Burkholderia cenocepacia]
MPSNTVTTYATVGNREDLIDKVFMISPTDTPFVSAISQTGATAIYHEWQTDALTSPANVALVEGADASYTAEAPTVRLGNYSQIVGDSFSVSNDLPPANRASRNLVKFVFGEDEHEEALFGRANHWLSEGSRGRYAGQGTVQEARVQ